ncbi:MAG: hypothetical protein ABR582_03320 [Gemmatimonadaceae bacterium]
MTLVGLIGVSQLFIEFDGHQLTVTTDDPSVVEYVTRNYFRMLVDEVTHSIGDLKILRNAEGVSVDGIVHIEHNAPTESVFPYLRREVLLFFVKSRPDLLWLHSGAVRNDRGAILISGMSGRGKSTIVTQLCARGWKLLSDEAAPIRRGTNQVLPFPQMPRRRVYPGRELREHEVGSLQFEEIEIAAGDVSREDAEIRAIVFPSFEMHSPGILTRLTPGDGAVETIRNIVNFADLKAIAVAEAAAIARRIPCYSLRYSEGSAAASLLDPL